MPRDKDFKPSLCAELHGFSLRAAMRCGTDERQVLEQLWRYITRPALNRTADGCAMADWLAFNARRVVLRGKLPKAMGDVVAQEQAFAHANRVLKNTVGGDAGRREPDSSRRHLGRSRCPDLGAGPAPRPWPLVRCPLPRRRQPAQRAELRLCTANRVRTPQVPAPAGRQAGTSGVPT